MQSKGEATHADVAGLDWKRTRSHSESSLNAGEGDLERKSCTGRRDMVEGEYGNTEDVLVFIAMKRSQDERSPSGHDHGFDGVF